MSAKFYRASLTAPTTPEQYRAAIERQERVIHSLRAQLEQESEQHRTTRVALENVMSRWDPLDDGDIAAYEGVRAFMNGRVEG